MVGLARVLFADPLWPQKAQGLVHDQIVPCEPTCSLCLNRVMHQQPAMCSRWGKDRIRAFKARIGEAPEAEPTGD
jgi:2,4-dienoyl-CoA reductase (NADPH2)